MEIWVHIVIILVILAIVAVIAAICCTTTCIDGGAFDNDIRIQNASTAYTMLNNKFPSLIFTYEDGDNGVSVLDKSKQIQFSIQGIHPDNAGGNNFEIEDADGESYLYKTLDDVETYIKNLITDTPATPDTPDTPVNATPVKVTPATPATPVNATPVNATPVNATPVKVTPVNATPATPATPVKATPVKATPLIRVKATPVDDRISNFNSAITMIKTQFPALTIATSAQYSATVFTPDYTHKFSIFGLNPTSQSIIPKFQIEYPNLDTSDFNTLDELSTAIQTYLNTSPNNMVLNQPNQLTPDMITSNKPKKINLLNNVRNISKKIQHGICNIL
jgi:hypothetical protein